MHRERWFLIECNFCQSRPTPSGIPATHPSDDFCFGAVVLDDLLRSLLPRSASNQRDIPSSVQTPVFFADDSTAEVYWLKVRRIDDGLEGLYPDVAEMGATVISSDLHLALHSMWMTAEITGFRGLWSLTPKTLLTSNIDAVPDYQFASPVLKGRSLELSALCVFCALRGGIPGDADFQFSDREEFKSLPGRLGALQTLERWLGDSRMQGSVSHGRPSQLK